MEAVAEEASMVGMSSTTFTVSASTSSDASNWATGTSAVPPTIAVVRSALAMVEGVSVSLLASGDNVVESVSLSAGVGVVSSMEFGVSIGCSVDSVDDRATSGVESCGDIGIGLVSLVSIGALTGTLSVWSCISEAVGCQFEVGSAIAGVWTGVDSGWTWVVIWIGDVVGFWAKKLGLLRSSKVGP